jgi:uncharacterized membrane protein
MDSQAKVLGHPLHQMLIAFPLGLLGTAAIFDAVHLGTGEPRWADISFWMIVAGVIGGLAAAVPGLIDWLAIPSGTRAKAVGAWHGIGNVIVIVLFAISLFLRWDDPGAPPVAAFVLSYGGVALALVTAWLGGELVDRLGVGVDTGAHLNAPSSLSDLPASAASEGRLPTGPATAD